MRISAAAFSVNVMARMLSTATPSSATACTKRSTSTVVLPVPAPARTISEQSRRATARRLLGGQAHPSHRQIEG